MPFLILPGSTPLAAQQAQQRPAMLQAEHQGGFTPSAAGLAAPGGLSWQLNESGVSWQGAGGGHTSHGQQALPQLPQVPTSQGLQAFVPQPTSSTGENEDGLLLQLPISDAGVGWVYGDL
jgi:hypothetical protein